MSDYTPTTEEVVSNYSYGDRNRNKTTFAEANARFDRWFADEMAKAEQRGAEKAARQVSEKREQEVREDERQRLAKILVQAPGELAFTEVIASWIKRGGERE